MVQLANAFGMDYQEFAPLPGGNLGSSQQSKIQHQKTQGKGPALIMSKIEHVLNNNGILPETVLFRYLEHDLQSEIDKANAAFIRRHNQSIWSTAGYLDQEGALEVTVMHRVIPEHVAEGVKKGGLAERWYLSRMIRQPQNSSQQILSGIQSQQVRSYGTDY